MAVELRQLSLADADTLGAFRRLATSESLGTLGSSFALEHDLSRLNIEQELRNPHAFTLGAIADGSIVGTSTILRYGPDPLWPEATQWYALKGVITLKAFRRNGIGCLLVEGCLQHASEKRAEGVLLSVNTPNEPAVRLYRSLGFEITDAEPEYSHTHQGVRYTSITMRKFLGR